MMYMGFQDCYSIFKRMMLLFGSFCMATFQPFASSGSGGFQFLDIVSFKAALAEEKDSSKATFSEEKDSCNIALRDSPKDSFKENISPWLKL